MNFEVATSDDVNSIVTATQRALIDSIIGVIHDIKSDTKQPGLTWDQLDYLLNGFKNKKVNIIAQSEVM